MYTFVRWNYIFIAPPLNINKQELDEGLAIISEALKIAAIIHTNNAQPLDAACNRHHRRNSRALWTESNAAGDSSDAGWYFNRGM